MRNLRWTPSIPPFTPFTDLTPITLPTQNPTGTMSIDRETFEQSEPGELSDVSTTEQVLGFLATNEDRAFKASEIAARTELDDGAVSTALTRLKRRSLVDHKGTFWAITSDEERLARYDGYERATALFNEQLGPEDRAAWREHAPDEPHPSLEDEDRDR